MIHHLIEYTLIWAVLLMAFQWWFSKRNTFQWNRMVLWGTLVCSAGIPLLPKWSAPASVTGWTIQLPMVSVVEQGAERSEALTSTSPMSFPYLIELILLLGFLVATVRIVIAIRRVSGLKNQATLKTMNGFSWWDFTSEGIGPFSFLNDIFIPHSSSYSKDQLIQILEHESAHVRLRHGWDNLLMAALGGLLWWNPLLYWFRKQMQLIHEFQADARVLEHYGIREYGQLLLKRLGMNAEPSLAHSFFTHPLKNRISMMKRFKKNQDSKWLYAALLPLMLGVFVLHSCTEDKVVDENTEKMIEAKNQDATETYQMERIDTVVTFDPETKKEEVRIVKSQEEVYKVVEDMPRFPGCEESGYEGQELKDCATKKLLEYIYQEVKYPSEAKEAGKEGTAVLQFVVNSSGYVSNIELVRDPGYGMGEEAMRVTQKMISEDIKWTPGVQSGKKVNVRFTLPIKYKLK